MRRPKRTQTCPFKIGDRVDYHSIIGGPVTIANTAVESEPWDLCGSLVVKIEGKAGGVDIDALTPVQDVEEVD